MKVVDNAVAPQDILDMVRVRAAGDHLFRPFLTFEDWNDPFERKYVFKYGYYGERLHALPFDEMPQLEQYDQEYPDEPRNECGSLIRRTVTVMYDDRGPVATYGITVDGEIQLWMD